MCHRNNYKRQSPLGTVSRKKVAVLLDFVQMRGGEGPAQIFCPLFTNCIYWVNLGMGREGETPVQIFWHIGVQKKMGQAVQIRGSGGKGDLDKIQKNSYFFWETVPEIVRFEPQIS